MRLRIFHQRRLTHVVTPFVVDNICAERGELAGLQRIEQRFLVDDIAAAGVDQDVSGL